MTKRLRTFRETLPIKAPIQFAANLTPDSLLAEIGKHYANRCHGGAFVISADRVTERGELMLNSGDATGHGYMDVAFEASVLQIAAKDLLETTVVAENGLTVGLANAHGVDIVVCFTPRKNDVGALRNGQKVFLVVETVQYPLRRRMPVVVGVLMSAAIPLAPVSLSGQITAEALARLEPHLAAVEAEIQASSAAGDSDAVAFFRGLLGPAAPLDAKDGELVSATDLVARVRARSSVRGSWIRHQPAVFRKTPPAIVSAIDPEQGLAVLLRDAHLFLSAVRRMAAAFPTPAARTENDNVWRALRAQRTLEPEAPRALEPVAPRAPEQAAERKSGETKRRGKRNLLQ